MSIAINLRHKVDLQTPQQVRHIGTLINQNDSGAHHVVLELTDGGAPAQLDGYTVIGAFARADGNVVMLGGTIDGSTVDVELTSACYAVAGPCMLSIKLTGEEMRTVYKAAGSVDTETDGDLVTDEQYSTFDEMVGKIVQEYLRDHPVQAVETDPTVPEWAKQPEPPKYTKADIGLSNVANVRQYSANNPPPYPVTSVNGMTGDVVIQSTGEGGGITVETDPTVPAWAKEANPPTYSKTDVGLGNVDNVKQYSASNPPPYPVTSVNGMTGDVVLEAGGNAVETDPTVPAWAKAENPPTYTAADVGATPATLSSGEYRVASETELETALDDVLSGMPNNSGKYIIISPANTSMGFGSAMLTEVYKREAAYATVRMNGYGLENTYMLCKTKWDNVWKPLAWINLPMVLGVEYRTSEMWNRKAVYAKLFDFGTLPNAANAYVSFNPSGSIDAVVGVTPVYYSDSFKQYFTGAIGEVDQCYASSNGNVSIKTNADARGLTAKVLVKYTLK